MWTKTNRGKYNRDGLRYPSDLTDSEWALVEPLIPPAKRGGRRREVDVREVLNGLLYVLSTGCQWRAVPKDLPPKSTLFSYFDLTTSKSAWSAGRYCAIESGDIRRHGASLPKVSGMPAIMSRMVSLGIKL